MTIKGSRDYRFRSGYPKLVGPLSLLWGSTVFGIDHQSHTLITGSLGTVTLSLSFSLSVPPRPVEAAQLTIIFYCPLPLRPRSRFIVSGGIIKISQITGGCLHCSVIHPGREIWPLEKYSAF